jgi:hypothetical protein
MLSSGTKCYHLGWNYIIWDAMLSSGAKFYHLEWNVIIWDEMLSSGMQCYHLELMISSGTKYYHLGWYVIIIRSLRRYRCGGDKMHKPYRSSPSTSPIALLMAWRVLNAMVYHRKSAARESLSTDPLVVRATVKDAHHFYVRKRWNLYLHFKGPGPF